MDLHVGDIVSEINCFNKIVKKGVITESNIFDMLENDRFVPKLFCRVKIIEQFHGKDRIGGIIDLLPSNLELYIEPHNGIQIIDVLLGKKKLESDTWYCNTFERSPDYAYMLADNKCYAADIFDNQIINVRESKSCIYANQIFYKYEDIKTSYRKSI